MIYNFVKERAHDEWTFDCFHFQPIKTNIIFLLPGVSIFHNTAFIVFPSNAKTNIFTYDTLKRTSTKTRKNHYLYSLMNKYFFIWSEDATLHWVAMKAEIKKNRLRLSCDNLGNHKTGRAEQVSKCASNSFSTTLLVLRSFFSKIVCVAHCARIPILTDDIFSL